MIRRILAPLDGSKLAEQALPYAEALADKFGAEIILLQVLQPQTFVALPEFGLVPYDYAPVMAEEEKRAAAYLHGLCEQLRQKGIHSRPLVVQSPSVASAIVDLAEEQGADVIVKTTHGRSGISRWVYGSVASKVLEQASCPVFLIRVQRDEPAKS